MLVSLPHTHLYKIGKKNVLSSWLRQVMYALRSVDDVKEELRIRKRLEKEKKRLDDETEVDDDEVYPVILLYFDGTQSLFNLSGVKKCILLV